MLFARNNVYNLIFYLLSYVAIFMIFRFKILILAATLDQLISADNSSFEQCQNGPNSFFFFFFKSFRNDLIGCSFRKSM